MSWEQIITIASLPLLVVGYIEAFQSWGPKVTPRYRRVIGYCLMVVAVGIYAWDIADRFGAFGPTKSQMQKSLAASEENRNRLQAQADYRRILLYGKDGKGGLQKENRDLNSAIDGPGGYKERLKARQNPVITKQPAGPKALVTGKNSAAENNLVVGTDRPILDGDNTRAVGNVYYATPSPKLIQQNLQQQQGVLHSLRAQYLTENSDAALRPQQFSPLDYLNAKLKKMNVGWFVMDCAQPRDGCVAIITQKDNAPVFPSR